MSGISLGPNSTANGCTAYQNWVDGIICSTDCHVINNNCTANNQANVSTNAGIVAAGNGNTIDSNMSDSNTNGGGYVVSGTRNLVVRNSAAFNGYNYNVAGAGNTYGPVIDMSAGGVISSASGTVNPWTNWIH